MKRLFDITGAVTGIIFLSPILCLIAILVRIRLGCPILFRQQRAGLHGVPFELLKFRTMTDATAPNGEPLPDDQRLTSFGTFLRKSSLDELPELWNILTGKMTLVGPRPLLIRYLDRYTPEQARRLEVPPGLTGWAQVNGRNASSWDERFAQDVWYVDNRSFWLDVKIIGMTFGVVFSRRDTSAESHATMPEFFPAGHTPTETGLRQDGHS